MDNDHGITGELRRFITDPLLGYASQSQHIEQLTAIADRIDAEHEQAMAAAALIAGVPMTDEHMAEHGWYRALCADRKPMLLGDRMEWANGTFTIHELKFTEGGCTTWDSEHGYTVHADECRHYHEPTVKDVLHELVDEWVMANSTEDEEAAIAECAKKLQIKEEA